MANAFKKEINAISSRLILKGKEIQFGEHKFRVKCNITGFVVEVFFSDRWLVYEKLFYDEHSLKLLKRLSEAK
jgi:hypothetical protein